MTPSERDLETTAALLTAWGNLTVDAGLSVELHGLAERLCDDTRRGPGFAVATRQWAVTLRSLFQPRGDGPLG